MLRRRSQRIHNATAARIKAAFCLAPVSDPITDVLELVLIHCDFQTLVACSHSGSRMRVLVQRLIRLRIRRIFLPFLPEPCIMPFFNLLRSTNAAITGSIPFILLRPDWPEVLLPSDVNLLIPCNGWWLWTNFFRDHGFVVKFKRPATVTVGDVQEYTEYITPSVRPGPFYFTSAN